MIILIECSDTFHLIYRAFIAICNLNEQNVKRKSNYPVLMRKIIWKCFSFAMQPIILRLFQCEFKIRISLALRNWRRTVAIELFLFTSNMNIFYIQNSQQILYNNTFRNVMRVTSFAMAPLNYNLQWCLSIILFVFSSSVKIQKNINEPGRKRQNQFQLRVHNVVFSSKYLSEHHFSQWNVYGRPIKWDLCANFMPININSYS